MLKSALLLNPQDFFLFTFVVVTDKDPKKLNYFFLLSLSNSFFGKSLMQMLSLLPICAQHLTVSEILYLEIQKSEANLKAFFPTESLKFKFQMI